MKFDFRNVFKLTDAFMVLSAIKEPLMLGEEELLNTKMEKIIKQNRYEVKFRSIQDNNIPN